MQTYLAEVFRGIHAVYEVQYISYSVVARDHGKLQLMYYSEVALLWRKKFRVTCNSQLPILASTK